MSNAALYDATGGPEVLYVAEVADPEARPGKVAVRVHAAGLNPFDGKVRSGFIPSSAPFPRRIGGDFAGTVEAVGADARYWDGAPIRVGEEVLGRADGAIAERVIANAADLARRPAHLPVEVAGGLNVAGLTAMSLLATVPVGASDILLIGGAAGGVGLMAAQLAIAAGARVIGTASGRNHELLRSLGVEPVGYGEGLATRVARLGKAMEGLENAVAAKLEHERDYSEAEAEVQRMNADRSRLAQELDNSEARAERLEDANKEVSRRLVTAMETIRAVLDR